MKGNIKKEIIIDANREHAYPVTAGSNAIRLAAEVTRPFLSLLESCASAPHSYSVGDLRRN